MGGWLRVRPAPRLRVSGLGWACRGQSAPTGSKEQLARRCVRSSEAAPSAPEAPATAPVAQLETCEDWMTATADGQLALLDEIGWPSQYADAGVAAFSYTCDYAAQRGGNLEPDDPEVIASVGTTALAEGLVTLAEQCEIRAALGERYVC